MNHAALLKTDDTILAGSAAFFKAYLENMNLVALTDYTSVPTLKNTLFVRGSAFATSRIEVEKISLNGAKVTYLSPHIIDSPDYQKLIDQCAIEVSSVLRKGENAILAIGEPVLPGKKAASEIKKSMAEVVSIVLYAVNVNELVIEGGSTTSAILEKLNFTQFVPTFEYVPGVVRMKIRDRENMYVTIKPGSYQFPEQVWNFKKNN
jgi:uncharacterized protein YgbK (DUF1537 family)